MRQADPFLETPKCRIAGDPRDWRNGAYRVYAPSQRMLRLVVSNGYGWEHVSVSLVDRVPTWEEMSFVKDLCWEPHEWVVQFHPPPSLHVNFHPFCLHLWRPQNAVLPTPPRWMVGPYEGYEADLPKELRTR